MAPIATISGSRSGVSSPGGVAVDGAGGIYVTDTYRNSVTVYAAAFLGYGAPISAIRGANTRIDRPFGVAVAP